MIFQWWAVQFRECAQNWGKFSIENCEPSCDNNNKKTDIFLKYSVVYKAECVTVV